MKASAFFLLCSMGVAQAGNTYAQKTTIKVEVQNATVEEVLNKIEKDTDFSFFYNNKHVDLNRHVSIDAKNETVFEILEDLFAGTNVTYSVLDKKVILTLKGENTNSPNNIAQGSFTVKGIIVDINGEPIIGANVIIKGTTNGIVTDLDGKFSINANKGDILQISYIGYQTQEIAVKNKKDLKVTLREDTQALGEVVVTALGLTKEKKALGYSVQEVKSESLNQTQATDLASKLSGKVAGLQVNTSNTLGGSSRIVLRGESTLSLGGNEAMIVVDGVPINGGGSVAGSIDWGNAMGDISSNDIESVSVLKGATAAALYGSRAGNGVILITTKKGAGKKGLQFDYNGSVMFESLLSYPNRYQYKYGPGKFNSNKVYNEDGTANLNMYDECWATEPYDPNKLVEWWYSPTSNGFRAADTKIKNKGTVQKLPYVSTGKNNYEEFFKTGITYFNSLSVSGSNENINGRLSYENMDQKGMQPGTDLKRNTLSSNLTLKTKNDQWKFNTSINYVNMDSGNRPVKAWNGNSIYYALSWMVPGTNFDALKDYWQPGQEGLATVNWKSGYCNPYYISHEIKNSLKKDRLYGNVNVNFTPIKNLNIMFRHGEDISYTQTSFEQASLNNKGDNPTVSRSRMKDREANTDFLISYKHSINDGKWNFDVNFGGNRRKTRFESLNGYSGILLVPGLPTIDNSSTAKDVNESIYETEVRSLYGFANIDYNNMLYLSVTGRNDWSSTLPKSNNSYFYPSATLSALIHEMVSLPKQITFFKVRGAIAQVGSDASAYQLINAMASGSTHNGFPMFSVPGTLANNKLKPEMSLSTELGLTMRFFDNRIGFDFSYYRTDTKDQVMPISLPLSSGYGSRMTNAGKIRNTGVELVMDVRPIQTRNFDWDLSMNFSTNKSKVIKLAEGLDRYELASFGDNGEKIMAVVGKPVMGIYGYKQKTVEDSSNEFYGEPIYNEQGAPVRKEDMEYLGKANPDWILGINNKIRFKDFSLSAVLDIRHGGICYSGATNIMMGGGYDIQTLDWRDNGAGGVGVIEDAEGNFRQNNIILKGDDIKKTWISPWRKVSTNNFYSSSFVKLREISLSYNLPSKLLTKTPLRKVTISLVGRNLLVWDKVPNQDPDVYRDGIPGYAGIWTYPSSRTYGFNLNVGF